MSHPTSPIGFELNATDLWRENQELKAELFQWQSIEHNKEIVALQEQAHTDSLLLLKQHEQINAFEYQVKKLTAERDEELEATIALAHKHETDRDRLAERVKLHEALHEKVGWVLDQLDHNAKAGQPQPIWIANTMRDEWEAIAADYELAEAK